MLSLLYHSEFIMNGLCTVGRITFCRFAYCRQQYVKEKGHLITLYPMRLGLLGHVIPVAMKQSSSRSSSEEYNELFI